MGGFFREVFQTENEVPECCTWVHLLHETLTDEEATEASLSQLVDGLRIAYAAFAYLAGILWQQFCLKWVLVRASSR